MFGEDKSFYTEKDLRVCMNLEINVAAVHKELSNLDAIERIQWAYEKVGNELMMLTSGGEKFAVMPTLMRLAIPNERMPIIFIDTGEYPPSTYRSIQYLMEENFDVRIYSAPMSVTMQKVLFGEEPWKKGEESFLLFRDRVKHQPLTQAMRELSPIMLLNGRMNHQTQERNGLKFVEKMGHMYHCNAILDWTNETVNQFIEAHQLPRNPDHYDVTKSDKKSECGIWHYEI